MRVNHACESLASQTTCTCTCRQPAMRVNHACESLASQTTCTCTCRQPELAANSSWLNFDLKVCKSIHVDITWTVSRILWNIVTKNWMNFPPLSQVMRWRSVQEKPKRRRESLMRWLTPVEWLRRTLSLFDCRCHRKFGRSEIALRRHNFLGNIVALIMRRNHIS